MLMALGVSETRAINEGVSERPSASSSLSGEDGFFTDRCQTVVLGSPVQFSDTLLYTHEVPAGQYGLDAILPLTGMRVAELLATQYKHAFTIVSTRKSFQLLAENEEERDDWIRSLKNAIRENQIKHRSFDPQLHGWAQVGDKEFRHIVSRLL